MPTGPKKHSIKSVGKSHKHAIEKKRVNEMAYNRQAKRQYKTNSKAWRIIREQQLNSKPLCEDHAQQGLKRIATVVDHRDGDSWNNEPENLRSLCAECHNRKTAKQDGGFGNRKL